MIGHQHIHDQQLLQKIKQGVIAWGGNRKLKIYGTLHCAYGKKMNRNHRVFFSSAAEAEDHGYRPCGHCMKEAYVKWKRL